MFALLEHLGVAYDAKESPLGQHPEGLHEWSPSGRIPLLVHGSTVVGESRVMLEHLSEAYAFEGAYPRELAQRTLHRQAMALMDTVIAPRLVQGDEGLDAARLAECLEVFERGALEPAAPCLLSFHFAPVWLRFQWWRPDGAVTRAIRSRPKLAAWLDGAAELPDVARTSPSRVQAEAILREALALEAFAT